jgi:hypothetical protein
MNITLALIIWGGAEWDSMPDKVKVLLFTQFTEVIAPSSGSEVGTFVLSPHRIMHDKADQHNSNNTHDGGHTQPPPPGTGQVCCLRPNNVPQTTAKIWETKHWSSEFKWQTQLTRSPKPVQYSLHIFQLNAVKLIY